MTLTTHAVVGAALTSAFQLNPGMASVAGLMSHFLLDCLPHWDYELKSAKIDETNPLVINLPVSHEAVGDFIKIGFDVLFGFGLALIFFTSNGQGDWESILAGALGGILPDALQFAYMKFRQEPFIMLQRFHNFMSSAIAIKNTLWGPFFQALILLLALILGNWRFFIR